MPDLDTLIARLEAAPVGSRELDAEIALAVGDYEVRGEFVFGCRNGGVIGGFNPDAGGTSVGLLTRVSQLSHYTTSLDAAIPGEDIIDVTWDFDPGRWWACTRTGWEGYGHTEALARRIAALRARQQNT